MPLLPDIFIKMFQRKCGIPLTESEAGNEFEAFYDGEFCSFLLEEASLSHNGTSFMGNLNELPYVFLLARKEAYTILAGAFAKSYDIGSTDGKLMKSQPTKAYLSLVKQMEETYKLYSTSGRGVRFTPVLLSNSSKHRYRNHLNAPDPAVSLFIESNTTEALKFRLTSMSSIVPSSYTVYTSDEPIYDMAELPPVAETATVVQSNVSFSIPQYSIDKAGYNPQYVGILTKNKYGRNYFLEQFIGLSSTEMTVN